jgi:hypothetical protein
MKYLSGMRFVRRRAALWMVSLAVLTAVGCGLSFGVDELTTSDAGPDTSPPDRPDGTLPDGALPDGALPDGAPIDDELIDDDASFPPSNIDAATGSFVLDAGTSLGAATEILALQPGALTVSSGDGGTIDIPPRARPRRQHLRLPRRLHQGLDDPFRYDRDDHAGYSGDLRRER